MIYNEKILTCDSVICWLRFKLSEVPLSLALSLHELSARDCLTDRESLEGGGGRDSGNSAQKRSIFMVLKLYKFEPKLTWLMFLALTMQLSSNYIAGLKSSGPRISHKLPQPL